MGLGHLEVIARRLMEEGRARYFGPAAEFDPAALNRVYQMDVGGYMRRSLQRWEELE